MRAAIILAAGRSRRFGTRDKLLVRRRGQPLIAHAIRTALEAKVARVIVVTDPMHRRRVAAIRLAGGRRVEIVPIRASPAHRASLQAGLAALRPIDSEAIILLGDLPAVSPGIFGRLHRHPHREAVRAQHRSAPGHPVLLRRPAKTLRRMKSGNPLFKTVGLIASNRVAIADIDRPGDLKPIPR